LRARTGSSTRHAAASSSSVLTFDRSAAIDPVTQFPFLFTRC
jgi:hypothetical protein